MWWAMVAGGAENERSAYNGMVKIRKIKALDLGAASKTGQKGLTQLDVVCSQRGLLSCIRIDGVSQMGKRS